MIGSINQDLNLVVRGPISGDQAQYINPTFRQNSYVPLPQITDKKLDGLYNVKNMPVVLMNSPTKNPGLVRQLGANNLALTHILFPNRMPYSVTP